jgi:hypothetical protein
LIDSGGRNEGGGNPAPIANEASSTSIRPAYRASGRLGYGGIVVTSPAGAAAIRTTGRSAANARISTANAACC